MIMRKAFLTAFASFMFSTVLFAQTLKDAVKLTDNEQFENADAIYKRLIASEPNNGDNYFYYGENYFKNEQLESAKAMYTKGVEVNANNPLNYVGLGKISWYTNNAADANANFFKAKTLSLSKNAIVLIKIAEVLIKAEVKNLPEAIKLLDMAIKLDPKNPEAYILMGDALLEQNPGSGGTAIANYEKATQLDKSSVKAILRTGQLWARARNYTEALKEYKKASNIDSTYAPAYREKAEIYFRAGQYQNAVAQYQKYLSLNNNISAKTRYAGFLYQAKQYKEAITQGMEVYKVDSSNVYLFRYLGYSYYENAEYPNGVIKMESFFRRAAADKDVKVIPQDHEIYGKLLAKTGKDSLGVIQLVKAYELDSAKKELFGDIGASYLKAKKYTEAIESYNKKIASGKANANDYFGLGRSYYFLKDFVNADSAFVKITRSNPELPLGYVWRAKANVQLDPKTDKGLAKPHYEAFISKVKPEEVEKNKKDLIDANVYLGYYYVLKKDYATAKPYYQKLKELDPNNKQQKEFFNSPQGK